VVVILLFAMGRENLIFSCALLKFYCWYEVLWLLVEFGVGKKLVVEKCGVLNWIGTRFAEILFIMGAKILIIIITLNSEVFKCRFEVIINIKLR
jgi:hypothetical protein